MTVISDLCKPVSKANDFWKLVWCDDFDYQGLPDPAKWRYEEGFVRNNESQFYTRGRAQNARVENGHLILEAQKEQFPNPAYRPGSNEWASMQEYASYTSASLTTAHTASWTYGRFEVRARLPQGRGVWPAIWTMGTEISQAPHAHVPWPQCGEIDIMEYVGHDADAIHGTIHLLKDARHQSIAGKFAIDRPFAAFHVYALEWFPDRLDFFVDNHKYHSVFLEDCAEAAAAFRKPHFLIINLALGGGWGGPIDDDILPQQYLIDYVRIFQHPGMA